MFLIYDQSLLYESLLYCMNPPCIAQKVLADQKHIHTFTGYKVIASNSAAISCCYYIFHIPNNLFAGLTSTVTFSRTILFFNKLNFNLCLVCNSLPNSLKNRASFQSIV